MPFPRKQIPSRKFTCMQKIVLACCAILFTIAGQSQTPFTGMISYTLHTSERQEEDAVANVWLGPGKIKMVLKETADAAYDKRLLVDLETGKVYNINYTAKTYTETALKAIEKRQFPAPRIIAGYHTTPSPEETDSPLNQLFGGILSTGSIVVETADSLYYPVPQQYTGCRELLMVKNNHIVLGMTVTLNMGAYADSKVDEAVTVISAVATAVNTDPIPAAEFTIPDGFTKEIPETVQAIADSAMVMPMSDTAMAIPAPRKITKKKTAKPATKKKTVVKAGTLRKP